MAPFFSDISDATQKLMGTKEPTVAERVQAEACAMCPSLSYKQRFWGFGICCAIGFLISIGSLFRFVRLSSDPTSFAVAYTIGNIVSLCGTSFIVGPWRQIKNMFASSRWIASLVYFGSMAGTLFVCYYNGIARPVSLRECTPAGECKLNSGNDGCVPEIPENDKCEYVERAAPYQAPLILGFVIVQAIALLWYILTYIPYGRTLLTKCVKRCAGDCV